MKNNKRGATTRFSWWLSNNKKQFKLKVMYRHRKSKLPQTSIEVNNSEVGEPIERKIERMKSNQEGINDGVPIQYTERKDGVLPQMNIRTSKMEMALDAMDIHSRNKLAKRENRLKAEDDAAKERLKSEADKNSGTESTHATK